MKQIEQTINSIEVAEMVGKEHSKLLRDIRNYVEQLNQSKIGFVDFFTESAYKDSKGETRPCYNVTKKGCEFIAHKLTGTKGTEFTARYINRFHDMEEHINNSKPLTAIEQLQLQSQAILEVNEKVNDMEQRVDRLEYDIPLYGSESDELSNHVKRKGVELLGGKKSNAYKDAKIRSAVYTDIYSQIKREYGLFDDSGRHTTYKALKRKYIYDVHELIDAYELPTFLSEQVQYCNAQLNMEV